ncbi:hemagglutinin/amebocyte aggregation factor-like [Xyrauchen texanus]|uniref:hemagglutinin/amebocyte aggregation factor-like n=1 Tax=Xyrauchen texanus TaxID=154827 RepID=UPI0022421B8B|nr:hemagglutinin/amebocyte aggregation factor-like [Xyrauchen texanus]
MRRVALFLLLTGLLASGQELRWQNNYDEPLNFNCPPGQSIHSIKSQHDNSKEDRLWDFGCITTFSQGSDCFLSPYANDFDQEFTFVCPPDHVIAGMSSYHDSKHEDRRWQFSCCRGNGHCNSNCQWSSYVNYFDEAFEWTAPHMHVLVGAESYHDNSREDRRWNYMYCAAQSC